MGELTAKVTRRAGTDEHPIVRIEGIANRAAAEELRGLELTVEVAEAPALEEGEYWASELEGCEVLDGERYVGVVARLVELPSCEALEVRLPVRDVTRRAGTADAILVPMVSAAIRRVDVERRLIDVDISFMEELL